MGDLPKRIYFDALALVPEKKSGVGLTLKNTLKAFSELAQANKYEIYLIAPLGKSHYLKQYETGNIKIKSFFLPARIIEALMRSRLLPPIDWFLGKGVYVFPNYRNLPLWKSRSLTYIYDIGYLKHPQTVQPKNQKYLSKYMNLWTGRADKIVTISVQVRDEIEKYLHVFYNKLDIVPCGVDAVLFSKKGRAEINKVKAKYDIKFDKYLLFVGNIEPRKNLVALLNAYQELPHQIRDEYGLVIVGGDGWLNQEFNHKLDALHRSGLKVQKIKSFVYDKDLPALYSGADLLIHPAIYEGYGMTPLEAMACGTAVAVSDLPAIKEVVQGAGYYFDPSKPKTITQAIVNAINDPNAMVIGDRGVARARNQTWQKSAIALQSIIDKELAKGPHRHPVISRLKNGYQILDVKIRGILGEKPLRPYRPIQASSKKELQQIIYRDYFNEQPNLLQTILLKAYLAAKHALALVLKSVFKSARLFAQ